MNVKATEEWLPVYEALASKIRLKIIQLLAEKPRNIKELANELGLSSAIITMHVKKLEKSGIISSKRVRGNGGVQKVCSLAVNRIQIDIPAKKEEREYYQIIIPVGHYTDFDIEPTCGLATLEKVIGYYDDPRYFLDPDRVNAKIIWFAKGYVEYKFSNYLLPGQHLEEIEISMEIGSEAPGYNNNWPSDIYFELNGVFLGQWTSPGDFGGQRGKYTPSWWNDNVNQYGLLKIIRITKEATYIDGKKVSNTNLKDIDTSRKQWSLQIGVKEDATHVGGVTIFGKGFGNYDQDIVVRQYYR